MLTAASVPSIWRLARLDFAPIYARVKGQPEFEPGDVLPQDRVIQRGTGAYHSVKKS